MPIRPATFTLKCSECGWKHTFAPRSDVLLLNIDIRSHCARCDAPTLAQTSPSLIERLAIRFKPRF